jgi:hypothetical protein
VSLFGFRFLAVLLEPGLESRNVSIRARYELTKQGAYEFRSIAWICLGERSLVR